MELLESLRQELKNNVDEKTLSTGQHFFKEAIRTYGVSVPAVNKISKTFFRSLEKSGKPAVFALCDTLWESGYLEEAFVACNWSYAVHTQYEPDDFRVFEKWIAHYVTNWATCDTLCNHTVGTFMEMYPGFAQELKTFALSPNRWMRRAAAVTLIIPARKGLFHDDIFDIALLLLEDKDDLVQKGYGWLLKAAADADRQSVFEFVQSHKTKMPRTALRYAIEKMPAEFKKAAMAK